MSSEYYFASYLSYITLKIRLYSLSLNLRSLFCKRFVHGLVVVVVVAVAVAVAVVAAAAVAVVVDALQL
jgi:hypothetical protein